MSHIDQTIYEQLCHTLGVNAVRLNALSGGSINKAFELLAEDPHLFCKMNSATKFPHLFEKESAGLKLLEEQCPLKTPQVIDLITTHSYQILLLEWIEPGNPSSSFWKKLGEGLAAMHAITQQHFGLDTDNYMGAIPQHNALTPDWSTFFIQNRLEPLVQQCHAQQLLNTQQVTFFQNLYHHIPAIYDDQPPALLHGDLWSGNYMCAKDGQPVLIDPAVYFGHRSIDLGMTTLFGGFDRSFYEAYQFHYPLPSNYKEQWEISNLYPLLIHLRLFGKSYLSSIVRILNDFK